MTFALNSYWYAGQPLHAKCHALKLPSRLMLRKSLMERKMFRRKWVCTFVCVCMEGKRIASLTRPKVSVRKMSSSWDEETERQRVNNCERECEFRWGSSVCFFWKCWLKPAVPVGLFGSCNVTLRYAGFRMAC